MFLSGFLFSAGPQPGMGLQCWSCHQELILIPGATMSALQEAVKVTVRAVGSPQLLMLHNVSILNQDGLITTFHPDLLLLIHSMNTPGQLLSYSFKSKALLKI